MKKRTTEGRTETRCSVGMKVTAGACDSGCNKLKNMLKRTIRLSVFLALMLPAACGGEYAPRTGDLLFQCTKSEQMSDAIVAATQRGTDVTFTHVGIVEAAMEGVFVIEATDTSVRRTPLADFLARSARRGGEPIAAVGRLRGADEATRDRILQRAHARLGLPYDNEFLPDNGKLYCSELVWECCVAADEQTHLLDSYPMTFRAADGQLPAYWAEHFAALGMPVPEGVAGTNPNDMAHDPAVEIVWRYYDEAIE